MKTNQLIAIAVAGTVALSSLAFAASKGPENSELPAIQANIAAAGVDLSRAIGAAEAHTQGRAIKAELDDENGQSAYEVEVLKGDQLLDVKVDSRDGRILSAMVDQADHEDGNDDD